MKNVFDTTAITRAFLNSDDTALTTNVFVTDPRLFGLRSFAKPRHACQSMVYLSYNSRAVAIETAVPLRKIPGAHCPRDKKGR